MFSELFKYYKSKKPIPEFTNVLDFNNNYQIIHHVTQVSSERLNCTDASSYFGFKSPPTVWKIYELNDHPGLIYIKNPFTPLGQKYWMVKCLEQYSKSPNKSNLLPLKQFSDAIKQDWWGELQKCGDATERNKLKKSMRWVTLGYHYNWDDKIYDDQMKNEFPLDLSMMCEYLASIFKYDGFKSQAAIINYYPLGSTLAGHTDHSETDLEAPLFSFSFGQSAIFLIGGKTKDDLTTPLLLESGDIVIMSKDSRICYHAVPRIFRSDKKPWFNFDDENIQSKDFIGNELAACLQNKEFWNVYENYISDNRININVRQVLPNGQINLF